MRAEWVDNPTQPEFFNLLQMKYALKIEMNTGLKYSRGSVLKHVNRTFDWNYRTKRDAYNALTAHIDQLEKRHARDQT